MKNLLEFLSNKISNMMAVVRRDKVYVALLGLLIVIFSFALFSHTTGKSLDTADNDTSTISGQMSEEDFNRRLQSADISTSVKVIFFLLVSGAVWGISMLAVSVFQAFFGKKDYSSVAESKYIDTMTCPWSLWDVIKVLIVFFTAYLVFVILQEQLIRFMNVSDDRVPTHFLMVLDMLFAEIVAVFFLLRILRYDYDVSAKKFGLRLARLPHYIVIGVKGYFMFLPIYILIVVGVSNLSRIMGVDLKAQEVLTMLAQRDNFTPFQLKMMILFVGILGPIAEEIFFRGLLYRVLKKSIGRPAGLLVSAVLFALIHNNIMAFFPIVGLGIMLGLLLDKTASLIPSIVMHCMVNSLSMFMLFSLIK